MTSVLWSTIYLFADAAGEAGKNAVDPAKHPDATGGMLGMLWPFLAIGVIFWLLLIRPQKKEQARRQAILAAVKKSDRVLTASGIYGVVTNVQREANEVTIKVDEATNTKLRVTLSSIAEVLGGEPAEDSDSK